MPSVVCRQPNGKLALFSTIPDGFTVVDADEQEMLDVLRQRGIGELERKDLVARGLDDMPSCLPDPFAQAPAGLTRWTGAIQSITIVHGNDAADEAVIETGGAGVLPGGFWDEFRRVVAKEQGRGLEEAGS